MSTTSWFAQNGLTEAGAPPPAAAGTPSIAPAKPAATSWFAKNGLLGQQAAAQPAPHVSPAAPGATVAHAPDITQNPKGEGIYQMLGADGQAQSIPYSKVQQAAKIGYTFSTPQEHAHYAKDYAADPLNEDAVDRFMDKAPWYSPMSLQWHLIKGIGTGAIKTAAGADQLVSKLTGERPIEALQTASAAAEGQTKGGVEQAGEFGENVGEFFSGEELLGMLGRVGKTMTGVDKLKVASQAAQLLNRVPMLAKLARIGEATVRNAAVGGAQSLAKTGGDTQAAGETAALAGVTGAAGEAVLPAISKLVRRALQPAEAATETVGGIEVPKGGNAPTPTPAQAAGGKAFGQVAGESIRPHLEAIQSAQGAVIPRFNINDTLARVGDYTRARQELADALSTASDEIDQATGGRFKRINSEITEAQSQARAGVQGAAQTYQNKLAEMQDLLKSAPHVDPALLTAIRGGWRQFYVLGDVSRALDRSLEGLPGESATSQAQRGIDGKKLLVNLRNTIITHGRGVVSDALGGDARLQALEAIGNATKTQGGRSQVNGVLREIARWIPTYAGAHVGWLVTGNPVGAAVGASMGRAAGPVLRDSLEKVQRAVLANPKIAQQVVFAVDSGADPQKIGPMLATLIQQQTTQEGRRREDSNAQQ